MSEKLSFIQVRDKNMKLLDQYVPIVARVHGKNHSEFYEIQKVFVTLHKKIKESSLKHPELMEEFIKLREITDNYKVPNDVCESYEAVYKMLSELDEAYSLN